MGLLSGRKVGFRLAWGAVLGGLVLAIVPMTNDPSERAAIASSTPVPMIWLDFTNTASYPGTGTAVTDLSPNARNGTIRGNGITFNSTAKTLQFPGGSNGTAYIELNANMNDFSGGITIEFEGEFGNTRAIWERIFDFALGVNQVAEVIWVGQFEGTNEIALEIFKNGTGIGYCYSATNGTALGTPGDRTLNKFVLSIGNDVNNLCRIYKNGVELPTRRTSFAARNISSTGANLNGSPYALPNVTSRPSSFVGRSNFPADNDLEGSIRYLRIYNQALTPSQVAQNATRTVTFNANNGQGSMTPQSASSSTALTTNTFTRPGYTFAGWNTAPGGGGTSYADGASYNFVGDLTLHAQWTPNTLNVSYDSQGGSPITAGTTTSGGTISASPGTPTRSGFNFNGWFSAPSGGTALLFPFTHGQTADFTLYAQWSAVTTTTVAATTTTVAATTTTVAATTTTVAATTTTVAATTTTVAATTTTVAATTTTVAATTTTVGATTTTLIAGSASASTTTSTTSTTSAPTTVPTTLISPTSTVTILGEEERAELASAGSGYGALPTAGRSSSSALKLAGVLLMLGLGLSIGQSRRRQLRNGEPISGF